MMSKVFELIPTQIAEIEGLKKADLVSISINRVSDQLRAGEISLFDFTEQEVKEAKARLNAIRERRRKHRSNNLEQMREYERNRNRNKAPSK